MKLLSITSFIFLVLMISFSQSAPILTTGDDVLKNPVLKSLADYARDEINDRLFWEGLTFISKNTVYNSVISDTVNGIFTVTWDVNYQEWYGETYNVKFVTTTAAGNRSLKSLDYKKVGSSNFKKYFLGFRIF